MVHHTLQPINVQLLHVTGHQDTNKLKWPLTTLELLNVNCNKQASKLNTTIVDPPDPYHPMLPTSYPHLQITQGTLIRQLQSNLHDAATKADYHKYLCKKYNWNPTDLDHIQWHTFHLAYNWFKKPNRKTIAKYNHNWLPLQTSHHVHSTSEQQYCPSCLGQPETTDHFLQCPQPDRNQHWVEYHEFILKHCICNPIPHKLNELLLVGICCSRFNDATIPLHISQNQQLASIIDKQQVLRWCQLLHGCFTSAWHDYLHQHVLQINSYQFFTKTIQLSWQAILQSWTTCNSHLHPPILMQTDRSQLQTSMERIFHEATQDPLLQPLINHITVDDVIWHPTRYIRQWVKNSHKHMQDHKSAQEKQATMHTRDIRQFFPTQANQPQDNLSDKNLLWLP